MRRSSTLLSTLALLVLLPVSVAAQMGPPASGAISASARVGYDVETSVNGALVVGAGLRASLPGPLELQVVGDLTFLDRLTERQLNVDVLWQTFGFAVGGGPAFRNTIWLDTGNDRETRTGFSLVGIFGGQATRSPPLHPARAALHPGVGLQPGRDLDRNQSAAEALLSFGGGQLPGARVRTTKSPRPARSSVNTPGSAAGRIATTSWRVPGR